MLHNMRLFSLAREWIPAKQAPPALGCIRVLKPPTRLNTFQQRYFQTLVGICRLPFHHIQRETIISWVFRKKMMLPKGHPLWVGGYMGKELAHSGSYHGDQDAVAWAQPPLKCNAQQQLEGKLVDYCPTHLLKSNLLKNNLLKTKCTATWGKAF